MPDLCDATQMWDDGCQDGPAGELTSTKIEAIQKKIKVEKFAASILLAFKTAATNLQKNEGHQQHSISVRVNLEDCDSGQIFDPQFVEEVLGIVDHAGGIHILSDSEKIIKKLAKFFFGNSQKELEAVVRSFNEAADKLAEDFALRGVEISNDDCGWGITFTAGGPGYLLLNSQLAPGGL